jgi:hypothetical protein
MNASFSHAEKLGRETLMPPGYELKTTSSASKGPNGKAHAKAANNQESAFPSVSRKTAAAAKKGETSGSRTGKGKQVSLAFSKPPKNMFAKVHPSPGYSQMSLLAGDAASTDPACSLAPTRPKVDAILQGANQQLGAISETKPAWHYRPNPFELIAER